MTNGTSYTGAGGTVVVIDSGRSAAWNVGNLVWQHDFAGGDGDTLNPAADTHGALVTSRILQDAPEVGIIALKVTPDGTGGADGMAIEQALQWVVANAAAYRVVGVNLSLAGGSAGAETTTLLSDELAALAAQRVLVSAAAGNAGQNGTATDVSWYAADHNQICVSASTGSGGFPGWAQRNPAITDLCADGTDVALTDLAGRTLLGNGSSFAAPAVTAAVALAQQAAVALRGSALTQDEFLSLARATGTPVSNGAAGGTAGGAADGGYVELNTPALLAKLAATLAPLPVQTAPTPQPPQAPISQAPLVGETPAAPAPATAAITVNAWGTAAAGVNAHFTLLVDGHAVGEATVGSAARNYGFTAEVAAGTAHTVQIRYDNDTVIAGQDRNLFVGTVTINGHTVAATDPSVRYDRGALEAALDGKDTGPGQQALWWNGALVVGADKSLFAAHTAGIAAAEAAAEAAAADAAWSHAAIAAVSPAAAPVTEAMADLPTLDGLAGLWHGVPLFEHMPVYEQLA